MSLDKYTILFVEDDKDTQEYISLLLKDDVRELYQAYDGIMGLELFKEKKPDIIITDIIMPLSSGIEFVQNVRHLNSRVPIIMMSAHDDKEHLFHSINLGVDGFITKPINIKDLINAIYVVMLPKVQQEQLEGCTYMVDALSVLVGGKKIEILKYIINNLDDEQVFYGSYQDIMENIGVSKPTVVNMFKQLIQAGILEKVKNKVYRFQNTKFIKEDL